MNPTYNWYISLRSLASNVEPFNHPITVINKDNYCLSDILHDWSLYIIAAVELYITSNAVPEEGSLSACQNVNEVWIAEIEMLS